MQPVRAALIAVATLAIVLPIGTAQTAPTQNAARALDGLDQFIASRMQKWKVPGLAIAVVQNGQVIYSRGFGLRDVKNNLPVTTKTLFAIGSASKSFTATSMGILNDEGKLDWDQPVRQYLPEFQMYDPVASERMTPRDLITHRAGMANHDLVWYFSDFNRADLVRRLRFLQSNTDFRSGFHYNNLLVMTAGYLVGQISGEGWERFVQHHLFDPLQMNSSNFSVVDSQKTSDFAHPYLQDQHTGEISEVAFQDLSAIGPAGSINSNVEDMARYAIFQLSKGKIGERQIISEANLALTHTPQVTVPPFPFAGRELGSPSYGMGWVTVSYRGHQMVWHSGVIDGFYALVSMLPDENFGVVILTNKLGGTPVDFVSYYIYDHLLGLDVLDWSQRFEEFDQKVKASAEQARLKASSARKPDTHPSHEPRAYAGRYENPGYGIITVRQDGDSFAATLNNKVSFPLRHFEYDIFEVPPNSTGRIELGKFRFLTDMSGNIDRIAAPLEPDAPEIIFTRIPENK